MFVFPDDIDGAVCRAAVHDDVFEVGVALEEDGADRLLDELALVVARRDNGDARPGRAVGLGGRQGRRLHRPWPASLAYRWRWKFS